MRRYGLLLCCMLLCGSVLAQKSMRYSGYVQMPNEPLVSYYLEIRSEGSRVHGYSVTGYKDGNRLKAKVEGYYSTPSDLFIREVASLDEPKNNSLICYFSAHLKLTIMMNGHQRWNGAFESHLADGSKCPGFMGSGGTMTIVDDAPALEDIPKPKPEVKKAEVPKPPVVARIPKDTPKPAPPKPAPPKPAAPKPTPKPVVQKPKDTAKPIVIIQQPAPKPAAEPEVPDSCQRTYHWNSPELVLDVWDGWTIDGDVISMTINGHTLLDHQKLSDKKQRFTVPLMRGLNVLYISLHEEGFDPPNTPNLTLFDGKENHEVAVSGNSGEVARICIWRK